MAWSESKTVTAFKYAAKKVNRFINLRQTYIDDIVNEQKRRPIPGPGKYDPIKTLE